MAVSDSSVRLVVGGSIAGDNKAVAGDWEASFAEQQYGGYNDLWGTTPTVAQVNAADFGAVISAETVGSFEADINGVEFEFFYTSATGDPGALLVVAQLDESREIATPYAYHLPRAGMAVANDPNITHAAAGVDFHTSRIYGPSRNVQKTYRAVEFTIPSISPQSNIPGFEMNAILDDGAEFTLVDAAGDDLLITEDGAYEAYFPATTAIGRWLQLVPTIPALTGMQVPVDVDARDITIHGTWTPKTVDLVNAVFVLQDNPRLSDGTTTRWTAQAQLAAIKALDGPRDAGARTITLHDPETEEDTTCVVTKIRLRRIRFQNDSSPSWVAFVELRKTPGAS